MAFDRSYLRITASGFLGAAAPGQEIWEWGLKASGVPGFNAQTALGEVDMAEISDAIADAHQSDEWFISNQAKFVTLKVAAVSAAGEYLTDALTFQGNGAVGFGGVGPQVIARQIAWCISLRTVTSIGLATHGRFYLPVPATALNVNARVDAAAAQMAATRAATMITRINTSLNDGAQPAVVSLMSDVPKPGTPTRTRAVTRVLVGDVYDTIRSRRNAMDEAYSTAAVSGI